VVAGDKNVRYEAVIKVMDDLQKQQVARVGLLVQLGQ
jgi:biopolymer transport protein TolR